MLGLLLQDSLSLLAFQIHMAYGCDSMVCHRKERLKISQTHYCHLKTERDYLKDSAILNNIAVPIYVFLERP